MKSHGFKNSFFGFLGVMILVGAAAMLAPGTGRGQDGNPVGPTKPVEIVNPATKPVPTVAQGVTQISGGVSVVNTPGVNVVNTPSVNVANALTLDPASAVQIANTASEPVPVNVQNLPARQPVQATGSLPESNAADHPITLYSVPAGKRLVIEYFSGFARGDEALFVLTTKVGGIQANHYMARHAEDLIDDARLVRIYADPGTIVTLSAITTASTLQNEATISGYLESLP